MSQDSEFQDIVVDSFGGGINTQLNPAFIRNDEWSWAHNVLAKTGSAQMMRPLERVIETIDTLSTPIMLGAFPDPADPGKILVALAEVHEGSRTFGFHLYKVDAADPGGVAVVEIPPTDIRPACAVHTVRSAVLNGKHMLSCGMIASGYCLNSILEVDSATPAYTVVVTPGTAVAKDFEEYFVGSGLNDLTPQGTLTGYANTIGEVYQVRISSTGTPDQFKWSRRGQAEGAGVNITGAVQTLEFGVQIQFGATTGHTLDDKWMFCVGSSLQAEFMLSFGGYLILAHCDRSSGINWNSHRTVVWSEANDPLTWQPALSNSADFLILDDSKSPITGLAELSGNRVAVYTDERTYTLTPTSRIPAFLKSTLAPRVGVAATGRRTATVAYEPSILVPSPQGLVVGTKDSIAISVAGEQRIVDTPVHDYIYQKFNQGNGPPVDHAIWMQEHRQVLMPTQTDEIMALETLTGAWGRIAPLDLGATVDGPGSLEVLVDVQGEVGKVSELWILDGASIWRERDNTRELPSVGDAFVDTKDFHVGHDLIEVTSIFVDWEGYGTYEQNWLDIYHSGRDAFYPAAIAHYDRTFDQDTGDTDLDWQLIGGLVLSYQSVQYLDPPRTNRFHRFRFKHSKGCFRIRGLKISYRRAGDQ